MKKKHMIMVLGIIVIISLLVACSNADEIKEKDERIAELSKENRELKADIRSLNERIDSLEKEIKRESLIEVTFPKMYVGVTDEEVKMFTSSLFDEEGNKLEYKVNSDGSVTVYEEEEIINEIREDLKKTIDEGMTELEDFMKVRPNKDMSVIDIYIDETMLDFFDDDTMGASLYHLGVVYQILSGVKNPGVEINLYNIEDEKFIKKLELNQAVIEEMAKEFFE